MFINILQDFVNLYKQNPFFAFIILLIFLVTFSFILKIASKLLVPVLLIIGIVYLCGGIGSNSINSYNKLTAGSPIGKEVNTLMRHQQP